jgi:hypothetical protein
VVLSASRSTLERAEESRLTSSDLCSLRTVLVNDLFWLRVWSFLWSLGLITRAIYVGRVRELEIALYSVDGVSTPYRSYWVAFLR